MNNQDERIPGDWGLWQWLILGVCGIVLALAIALAAGNLARQPVGLSGEPVSAGSALDPAAATRTRSNRSGRNADSKRPSADGERGGADTATGIPATSIPAPAGGSTTPPATTSPPDTTAPPASFPPSNVQSGEEESEGSSAGEPGKAGEDD
ncbi:MAG: hypothetical protein IPK93_07035 [Solirubrobacterales bacterium]|nr:hypothetical protein [Solirubrobacterales bacterium]